MQYCSTAGGKPQKAVVKAFQKWLGKVKSKSHTPEMYEHESGWGEAFVAYQNVLRSSNAVDFNDIPMMVRLSLPHA